MGVPRSDVKWLVSLAERLIPVGGTSRDNGTHAGNKGSQRGVRHSTRNGRK